MLRAENISKQYDGKYIVKNLTEEFREGGVSAIIAPNGSGKTTLLSILSGLLLPDSGRIICGAGRGTKNVTIVLSGEKNLYVKNTVEENLFYFGVIRGLTKKKIKERIGMCLPYFPLYPEIRHKVVEKLSYGQKRLAAVFSAIVSDSECVLLDEATEGLDADHVRQIKEMLMHISGEKLILLASHDYEFVADVSSRIYFLKDGTFVEKRDKMSLTMLKELYDAIYQNNGNERE